MSTVGDLVVNRIAATEGYHGAYWNQAQFPNGINASAGGINTTGINATGDIITSGRTVANAGYYGTGWGQAVFPNGLNVSNISASSITTGYIVTDDIASNNGYKGAYWKQAKFPSGIEVTGSIPNVWYPDGNNNIPVGIKLTRASGSRNLLLATDSAVAHDYGYVG